MQTIERLEKRLCKEMDEIAEKERFSSGDLEMVDKSTRSLANLAQIKSMSGGGGYSQRGGRWNASGDYGGQSYADMPYDSGYAQRRRRDMGGRYSNAGSDPMELRQKIRELMEGDDLTAYQRNAAQNFMNALERG